jgi:hypothetical protein
VIRTAALLAALAALAACIAAAAPPTLVVKLAAPPDTLVAGQRWAARLTVRPPARPTFRAASAGKALTSRATATGRGRYTAIVRFPSAGIWRLAAVVRGRTFPLGRVRVLASYPLALPAQILALDERSLLVVEREGRDRVLRVDTETGRFSVVTKRIPSPWGLARTANGGVLVSGGSGIYELGGRKIAAVAAGPLAAAPNGDLYFADQTRVARARRRWSHRDAVVERRRSARPGYAPRRIASRQRQLQRTPAPDRSIDACDDRHRFRTQEPARCDRGSGR